MKKSKEYLFCTGVLLWFYALMMWGFPGFLWLMSHPPAYLEVVRMAHICLAAVFGVMIVLGVSFLLLIGLGASIQADEK